MLLDRLGIVRVLEKVKAESLMSLKVLLRDDGLLPVDIGVEVGVSLMLVLTLSSPLPGPGVVGMMLGEMGVELGVMRVEVSEMLGRGPEDQEGEDGEAEHDDDGPVNY